MATQEEIKKELGKKNIAKMIADINNLPHPYFDSFEVFERYSNAGQGEGVTAKVAYLLHSKLVNLPRTATILLELLEFKPTEPHIIFRETFEKHIVSKFKWDLDFVKDRLDAAIGADYITIPTKGYIWKGVRIYREVEYIKLIAAQLSPIPAEKSSESPKTKTLKGGK